MDDLPSPVQGRGDHQQLFRIPNRDSDALLSRFADALQLKRLEMMPPSPAQEKTEEQASTKTNLVQKVTHSQPVQTVTRILTPDLLIGGSLAFLLVVLITWGAVQ